MAEKVGFEVDVDLGSFRQQLRTAQQDAFRLVDQFGQFSPEAVQAAKRVAELRDKIGDTNSLIKAFNPDQKFAAFSQALRSVTGGFAAAQGAMALFGKQSEEVQQQLLKVQAALALSEGLNSFLDDGIQGFKNLGSVIKGQVVAAFTTLKGAIAATGIGLAAVAVASLIANWEKLVKVFRDAFPEIGNMGERLDQLKVNLAGVGNAVFQFLISPVKAFIDLLNGDFKKALKDLEAGVQFADNFAQGQKEKRAGLAEEQRLEEIQRTVDREDDKIKVLKAKGEETYALEKKNLERRLELAKTDEKKYNEIVNELQVLIVTQEKKASDARKKSAEEAAQERQKALEKRLADEKAASEALKAINLERSLVIYPVPGSVSSCSPTLSSYVTIWVPVTPRLVFLFR